MAILKIRKPRAQWSRPDRPEFYPAWYVKIRGQDGKQLLRNTGFTAEASARREERRLLRARATARWEAVMGAMDEHRMRAPRAVTIGDLIDVLRGEADGQGPALGLRVFAPAVLRRNCSSLYLVLAYAKGLWTEAAGRCGVRTGERTPDVTAIRKLTLGVLSRKLVLDYFGARVGGDVAWKVPSRANITVNKTLNHARNLFSRACLTRIYEGRLVLPDVSGFTGSGYLPVVLPEPAPLAPDEFDAMCAASDSLAAHGDDQGVATVNLILRQTGMRVGSLMGLREGWIRKMQTGWVCEVQAVKGGTTPYVVPVSEECAAAVRRWESFDEQAREAAVRAHNDWLGAWMPGDGVSRQRAHRLRDTVGTVAKVMCGLAAAVEMLGHACERTTIRHYARLQWDVSARMRQELAEVRRLVPGNVVVMAGQGVAA